jgi:hypothetical protein
MGGSASKPTAKLPTPGDIKFTPDYSAATVGISELQKQLDAAQTSAQAQAKLIAESTTKTVTASLAGFYKPFLWLLGIAALILLGIVLYDTFAPESWPNILFSRHDTSSTSAPPPAENSILFIDSATYENDSSNTADVTAHVKSLVQGDTTLPGFTVSYSALGLSAPLIASTKTPPTPNSLVITYHLCGDAPGSLSTGLIADGASIPSLPKPGDTCKSTVSSSGSVAAPPPSVGSRIYNAIFGDSSGDLAPSYHDASSSAIIQGNRAPLSAESEGGYGMQWWMYVKDWNYGYGKKKSVVKRPDTTNSAVMNPHISLHPTDNTLQISVSVFPATEGGSSKSTPAPAGHSGSTDDVFVCDVPNIPLQTWFSVSMTIFGRNLDVYIDGKLVKSCFLSGVPKPAVGDIQLTPEGGFSGRMCNFYHYPKMLTPADAMIFWSAGTSCRNKTESGVAGKTTGYSVKFGVYDTLGKNVQEYTF